MAGDFTKILMGVCFAVLVVWDVYVAFFNKEPNSRDTISGILLGWSRDFWGLPFAAGALLGHLFWPLSRVVYPGLPGALLLVAFAALVSLLGLGAKAALWRPPRVWHVPILLSLGVYAGHMLWPQIGGS